MPQPEYVPVIAADEVRPVERLPAPRSWRPDRPGDAHGGPAAAGRGRGVPGPDQGYGLRLLRLFAGRLVVLENEDVEDVEAGGLAVALKRAALFGRAPVVHDLEHAFTLWGALTEDAPEELVEYRFRLFRGAAHHYWDQRVIVDQVPEATLRLTPAEVAARLAGWQGLVTVV